MRYLLDTNSVGFAVRGHPIVRERVIAHDLEELRMSAVTLGEIAFGLAKRQVSDAQRRSIDLFLQRVEALPWDRSAAEAYGTLRAGLQARGTPLAPLDLMIAAHALAIDLTLVTNDRAFARAGLRVEDWTLPA